MIAPINITPPKNWQDFETLCLRLWGEIWNIPHEIEFNSDNSQGQQGVDIYAPVKGGLEFYGIQCKNKKLNLIDGSPNRITTTDIQTEIDNAKEFKPTLTKLIIATSLQKDRKIEEYVREKSLENLQNGLFSIQICFWDYFERKIPEFQKVYDWYLKNENFHRVRELAILFDDGSKTKLYHPKFLKTINRYIAGPEPEPQNYTENRYGFTVDLKSQLGPEFDKIMAFQRQQSQLMSDMFPKIDWNQRLWFKLSIKNKGQAVIEDYKIELDFEGDFKEVGAAKGNALMNPNFSTNVREYSNTKKSLWIKPSNSILVQNDSISSGSIYLDPLIGQPADVKVYWKLLSRDFEDSGSLEIKIQPLFHKEVITHYIDDPQQEKETESITLIKRKGSRQILTGALHFEDKESDFKFES
jgi:hypothetical protein